jgi:hypothetical protein
LPVIGGLAFELRDGHLLASELAGHQVVRIELSQPDQPAAVTPILFGFRRLNFGVFSFSPDDRRLAVIDFEAGAIFILERTVPARN